MTARTQRVREGTNEDFKEKIKGNTKREPLGDVKNNLRVTRSLSLKLGLDRAECEPGVDKENEVELKETKPRKRTVRISQGSGVKGPKGRRGQPRDNEKCPQETGKAKLIEEAGRGKKGKTRGKRVGAIKEEVGVWQDEGGVQVTEEVVEDVDERYRTNKKDPINVYLETEYTKDIYSYLRQQEKRYEVKRVKAELEGDRSEVMDWMVYAHWRHGVEELGFGPESLHLAVWLVEAWLERRGAGGLEAAAVAALVVAAKWHERRPPVRSELCHLAGWVSERQVVAAEQQVLALVDWRLGRPDPMAFLRRWSLVGCLCRRSHAAAKFFLEVGLLGEMTAPLPPSLLAAASVLLALCVLAGPRADHWTPQLSAHAYPLSQVSSPASLLATVSLRASFSRSFVSVVEKFSADPYQTSVYLFKGVYLCNLMFLSTHTL